jgi:hypothetical protein
VEGGVRSPNPLQTELKPPTNGQHPLYILAEVKWWYIYTTFHHQVNISSEFADRFCNSMIDDKDSHIPLPQIIFSFPMLSHAFLDWLKNNSVHRKASKSKLKSGRPDLFNYFNSMNVGGKNASCCGAMGPKLICLAVIAHKNIVLMNTWNMLPESYEQRVNTNTVAALKHQIQQAENTTPAVVTSIEGVWVDNIIVLHILTFELEYERPQNGSTNGNILISNNCMDNKLQSGMPGGSWDYEQV